MKIFGDGHKSDGWIAERESMGLWEEGQPMINYINTLSFITETVAKVGYSNDVLHLSAIEMIYLILIIGFNYFSLALLIEKIAGFKLKDPLIEYTKKLNDDVYDIFRNPLVKTKMIIRKTHAVDND